MNKHLKELYRPSIDGIETSMVTTPTFSPEEKQKAMELLLTGNKPLSISLGLSRGQLKLEWNVCNLKAYFHTIVNKSLLKAICDKLQGEEVNIKELNIEEDEYTNSSTKCVEYLQRRLKISKIEYIEIQPFPLFLTEFNYGKRGFLHLVCKCEEYAGSRYSY
jgi:hypothetical protein